MKSQDLNPDTAAIDDAPSSRVRAVRQRKSGPPRQLDRRFRQLVESVGDYGIFMLDPTGVVTSWNPGAERIKGYSAKEIVGQHFSRFYTDEDKLSHKPERELQIAAAAGKYAEEGWRVRKDGSRFWASVLITAVRDSRGRLIGFSKVSRDLTERRTADQTLRESEERFRLMVDGVMDYPRNCS